MKGTAISEKRAIERRPPKMINAVKKVTTTPTTSAATPTSLPATLIVPMSRPKAPTMAPVMVFDCTELNAKPKAMIRKIENIVPAQRWPRPFSM